MGKNKIIKAIIICMLIITTMCIIKSNSYAKYVIIQNLNVANINIDITPPKVTVTYERTESSVIVTITANEEIKEVSGWELKEDKKTLIKGYKSETEEIVRIKDIYNNQTRVNIVI